MGKLSNALVSGLGDDCKIVIASGSVCVAYKNGVTLIAMPTADSDTVTKAGNPILAMCKTTFDDKTNVGIMNTMIIKGKARKEKKDEEEESPKKGKKKALDTGF